MPEDITQPSEQAPGRRRHRRRSRHHPARRRQRRLMIALGASVALAASVWIFAAAVRMGQTRGRVDTAPVVSSEQYDWLKKALADTSSVDVEPPGTSGDRQVFKYSVIPGGAFDANEMRKAMIDPVVAAHYAKLDQAKIRAEIVQADRYVHVSYRKNDKVFWSKKKVLLRKGETILTDGTMQIRSRCGNCISDEPLEPTANDEPDVLEFDRLVDSTPAAAPSAGKGAVNGIGKTTPAPVVTAASQPVVTPASTSAAAAATPIHGGGMPFIGSGAGSVDVPLITAKRAGTREPGDTPGGSSTDNEPQFEVPQFVELPGLPKDNNNPPAFDDLVPPGNNEPNPNGPNGPNGSNSPNDSNGSNNSNDSNDSSQTFGPTSEDPFHPTDEPVQPTPVPEPGTIMLVGGGVAALFRRLHRRSHS